MVRLSKIRKGKDISEIKSLNSSSILVSPMNGSYNPDFITTVLPPQNEEKYAELDKYLSDNQIPELLNVTAI